MNLENKVVVVTGGSAGLGEQICYEAAKQGAIETAFFDQADPSGNYLANLGSIVLEPNKLARTIVKNMIHPKREINRPHIFGAAAKLYTLFPSVGDYMAGSLFNKK